MTVIDFGKLRIGGQVFAGGRRWRSATTGQGGHEHLLRQTVIALAAGATWTPP